MCYFVALVVERMYILLGWMMLLMRVRMNCGSWRKGFD
jgi:hypothetical protein